MAVTLDNMEYANDAAAQAAYVNSSGHHVITFTADAQLSTAQKEFGGSSLLLDGTGDYVSAPDSADWHYDTNNFTLDFWVRWNGTPTGYSTFIAQDTDGPNRLSFQWSKIGTLFFRVYSGGSTVIECNKAWSPAADTWYHVAMVRNGTTFTIYINGTSIGSETDADAIPDFSGALYIGAGETYGENHNGWMDEVRISNTARWTSNFTPETSAYQTDANTKLLLHLDGANAATSTVDGSRFEAYSESTIKHQGSYSLKCVAIITSSLNNTLTRTVSPVIDLSGEPSITIYAYASRTGENFDVLFKQQSDSYTKLLLHAEGVDAATSMIEDSESAHTVTFVADAQIDTAQEKFGQSSVLFDGTGDYLTVPDHADWAFGSGNFTIDFQVRFASVAADIMLISQYADVDNRWYLKFNNAGSLYFLWEDSNVVRITHSKAWSPNADTWYHVALVRNGTTFTTYVDGTSLGDTTANVTLGDIAAVLQIGAYNAGTFMNGHIDEFRISKGVARWTSNFTAPTVEHDLIRKTVNIASAGEWESHLVDISGVANKDKIKKIIVTPINAAAENTFYLDCIVTAFTKTLTDTLALSESHGSGVNKVLADTLALADSFAFQRILALVDTLTVSDSPLRKFQRPLTDTLSLADSVAKKASKVLIDTLAMSDSRVSAVKKALSDTLAMSEAEVKSVSKVLSDTLSLSESEVKKVSKALTDTLALSESIYIYRILNLIDTLALADSEAKEVKKVLSDTLTLAENEYVYRVLDLFDTLGLDDWQLQKLRGIL